MSDPHETAQADRKRHVDAVVSSNSKDKVVVAGPGTGKTYLFKQVLEGKPTSLTLTFVTALVEELSLDLGGLSEVRTLHGFARAIMTKALGGEVKIFAKLPQVIRHDAILLLKEDIKFEELFHNLVDDEPHISFYKARKNYYGHYGFTDIVYAAVRYLEANPTKIPKYDQVLVDEFQDFCALEVSLIDLLAGESPTLLAGDDDQALYESLKGASPNHLRVRHRDTSGRYAAFCLPYCSRCSRVIVEAVNDMIAGATKAGFLKERIAKRFEYFTEAKKDAESAKYPTISYTGCFAAQTPWFVQNRIEAIAQDVRSPFTVLVISPTRVQARTVAVALRKKGFKNVQFMDRTDAPEPSLLDGFRLLLDDKDCRLGWRIVAEHVMPPPEFKAGLEQTSKADVSFANLIESKVKAEVREHLATLRAIRAEKKIEDDRIESLFKRLRRNLVEAATHELQTELDVGAVAENNPGVRKVHITATTIPSSKGLAADYVFITHCDDRYLIRDAESGEPTDQEICSFLVALTRARRRAFLISSDVEKVPRFVNWIDTNRLSRENLPTARRPRSKRSRGT